VRTLVSITAAALISLGLLVASVAEALDTQPPETTITSGPTEPVSVGRVTFTFDSDESGSTFECKVDDEPFAACTSPFTTGPEIQGSHTFRVRATDPSGNVDPTPAAFDFVVDKSIAGANASARRSQHQSGRAIVIRITVRAGEDATVSGAGTVDVGKGNIAVSGPAVLVPAGTSHTISLVPTSSAGARRIRKEIKHQGEALAKLTATFVDAFGNQAISGDILVKLKGR
jgi:hypothetical protein